MAGRKAHQKPERTIGEVIQALRLEQRLSQAEIAERAGVPAQSISRLERDLVDPTVSTVRRIAAALDVPISAIFALLEEGDEASARGEVEEAQELCGELSRLLQAIRRKV